MSSSSSSTTSTCQDELAISVTTYNFMVGASIALTLFTVILYSLLLKQRLHGAPALAAQFFFVTGTIKLFLGVLILSAFLPTCPAACTSCTTLNTFSRAIYPCLAIGIGLLWIHRGYGLLQMARTLEGDLGEGLEVGKTADAQIFHPIATTEHEEANNNVV